MGRRRAKDRTTRIACLAVLASVAIAGCVTMPVERLEPAPPAVARVVTLNMRFVDLTREDPAERARALAAYIREVQPDIVGLQEVSAVKGFDMALPCPVAATLVRELPEYGWIRPTGVSLLSGTNPILYDHERYFPVKQGVLWMSETPDIPDTRSWGNDIPRYATWAVLYDHHGGEHVLVVNVHLDHVQQATNRRAVSVLEDLIAHEGADLAVILMGDFNAPPAMRTRRELGAALHSVLAPGDGPTFQRFPRLQIDGIYHSAHLTAAHARIDPAVVEGPLASDHAAVLADLLPAAEN